MTLPLTIEALVSALLLLTILYCVRLNGQLQRLRTDESAMRTTIGELLTATANAERSIEGLKMTLREAEQGLGDKLAAAEKLSANLGEKLEAGQGVLANIAHIVGVRQTGPVPVTPAAVDAPDARSLVAAAQAFADRARLRVKSAA